MGEKSQVPAGTTPVSEKDLEMMEAAKGLTGQTQQSTQQPVAAPAAGDNTVQPAQEPGPGQQQVPGQPAAQEPVQVKTPFGTQTFGDKGGPVLSSWEDAKAYAKDNGYEIKDVDDLRGLLTKITELKQQTSDIPALQSAVNAYKSQIGGLPPEVLNVVEAAIAGQDYKSIIKDLAAGATLDLTRPYGEHSAINLIRQYAQPGITQEVYDELSEANKDALGALARSKYETDQTRWQEATRSKKVDQEAFQQKFTQSIETAVQNLKIAFPDMTPEVLKTVADKMAFGFKDTLFNPDNTYKPEAGVKIAMQEYGQEALSTQKNTIGQLAQQISGKIAGKVNEQILQRSDVPDQQGRQVNDGSNVVADSVKRETGFLSAK